MEEQQNNVTSEQIINDFCLYCKDNGKTGIIIINDNNQIKHAAYATAPLIGLLIKYLQDYYYNRYSSSYLELLMFLNNLFGQNGRDMVKITPQNSDQLQIV